uniref:DWNN domain-containing protein n=1 Tax=Anolis carolinensis TaxID=28377 RepID=A0A803TBC4_ANOCA
DSTVHQIFIYSELSLSFSEYTDDNALIPKNSSVIVRRIPIGGVKCTSKTYVISRTEPVSGPSKAVCKNTISHFFLLHIVLNF